jgi:hypothetical protein
MVFYYICVVNVQTEVFALLKFCALFFGSWLSTFWKRVLVLSSRAKVLDILILKDGTDILSRNVINKLPTDPMQHSSRAKTSILLSKKLKVSQFSNHYIFFIQANILKYAEKHSKADFIIQYF